MGVVRHVRARGGASWCSAGCGWTGPALHCRRCEAQLLQRARRPKPLTCCPLMTRGPGPSEPVCGSATGCPGSATAAASTGRPAGNRASRSGCRAAAAPHVRLRRHGRPCPDCEWHRAHRSGRTTWEPCERCEGGGGAPWVTRPGIAPSGRAANGCGEARAGDHHLCPDATMTVRSRRGRCTVRAVVERRAVRRERGRGHPDLATGRRSAGSSSAASGQRAALRSRVGALDDRAVPRGWCAPLRKAAGAPARVR